MSSSSGNAKLVYMANQIGDFFNSQDSKTASEKVADHIRKYWDPRMRGAIIAEFAAGGGAGLDPAARQAIEILRLMP